MTAADQHASVVLVREWDRATTGCCGRLPDDDRALFAERRRVMTAMGPLYQALREAFGDRIELQVIDPRNLLALYPLLVRDAIRYRVPWRTALATIARVGTVAVVINGRLVARGAWPEPLACVAAVRREMSMTEHDTGQPSRLQQVEALLREFYTAPYRGAVARARRDEDDLFMLMVYAEMLGVPNPVQFQTLELQPLLLERFHDWHRRMGMEHSPLDHFRCC